MTNPLRAFADSRTPADRGIWKWHHYFDIYEQHLRRFSRGGVFPLEPMGMLEIGVFGGGSLDMWREYFPSSTTIYGVDIDPDCRRFSKQSINVHIGNAGDGDFWAAFRQQVPILNVVIDDGSHHGQDQLMAFRCLYQHLQPGGVYIVEDVEPNRFFNEVLVLAKQIQPHEPFSRDESNDDRSIVIPASHAQIMIGSIHVYPMMVVVEKPAAPVIEFVSSRKGALP